VTKRDAELQYDIGKGKSVAVGVRSQEGEDTATIVEAKELLESKKKKLFLSGSKGARRRRKDVVGEMNFTNSCQKVTIRRVRWRTRGDSWL